MAAAAAAAFSIREYAASMRCKTSAEGRRLLGVEDLPPLRAPRCRWWADELASTVAAAAAAASPRRAPGKAKPPKKRSISDLFAAAPPLAVPPAGDTGCKEQAEVDGDEALCAIARRAKEEKKRKRKLQEEEEGQKEETAAVAAAPESSGGREPEGNFAATKEVLHNPNLFDGLDTHSSQKPEAPQHHREEREKMSERRKQWKINNINKKKADTQKHIDNNKADKVGKQRDLESFIPKHGILKCTKHTSVKMVKEKRGNSEGKEVIELCRKSVKRVKFSEADAILELPERQSLCKIFSDAMASSSSSSSSSSSFTSTEGDKCITSESGSSHMPMEAFTKAKEANKNPEHEDSPDKCITAESGTSHIPMEAFTKTKEANKNSDHEDSPEPGNREMSASLIDLNMVLPESPELDQRYDSYSEVPNLEHTHEETLSSDVQLLDGRENRMNFSVDSHRLDTEQSTADLERLTNSSSAGTFLHGEVIKVSDTDAAVPPLSLTEHAEARRGCSNVSVKDTMTMSTSPCALPDHTFQGSFRQHQSWFSTSGKFSSWPSHESNVSQSKELNFRSKLNVPRENGPSTGQTVRLMGKDLSVCTTRAESFSETAQKHTGTFTNDYLNANVFLPQQGRPFLSLQAQNFPNDTVNSTSIIHAPTYNASGSQVRTTHGYSHHLPAANVLSGDQLPYENRFIDFSNSKTNRPFLLGCPPPSNHGSAAFQQNSPSSCYYSDSITRTEPPTAPPLPTSRQHGTPSSGFQANLRQQHVVHPASSSVCHLNSVGLTFNHPDPVVQVPSNSIRDATLLARNTDNRVGSVILGNSNTSPSGRYVQKRSGPVKLTPGAKHVLVPNNSTGDGDSAPVYSCVSFASRSTNAAGPQNKGA
ncbi:hypothetical protein CFC21_036427 [Triticum aestivum]|uniref:Uncharacterized protein n=3 Tax=Triticum TaxID=4564 RepID=A0A9R0VGF4_TRITD|nr:uncharacterized protein LOC119267475 [Triticum dicoccoides]XP_044339313.1 uncharacterized protein LOC123060601 [Triticum aestivum]KAF7024011.1 hypothetical protein CFC21_036427 [Triticum aestivum]VAH58731.1 unnamed protein product [Triticum turgidum subsp. durum]